MSEFVKKTIMGYKPLDGGYSDPECTHVIMEKAEYDEILDERRAANLAAVNAKSNAEREIRKAQGEAERKARKAAADAQKAIDAMRGDLDKEKAESAHQRALNENLLRIARERANSDRGLTPKKKHTGYVVLASGEKELRRKESGRDNYYYITRWETVLQSPYSVEFTEEQARKQICEELMKKRDGGEWMLARIGIYEKPKVQPFSLNAAADEDDPPEQKDPQRENFLLRYRLRENYQARRENETGFWEIVLTHKMPLLRVPKDMMA